MSPSFALALWTRRFVAMAGALLLPASSFATDVLSYHYDQQSTGLNSTETLLTPANVVPATFMKRWATAVDGYVYAQPLYKAAVQITAAPHAGVHNTVFAATEHDSLYAIDATSGLVLWHRSLLTDGLPGVYSITTVPSPVDTSKGDTGSNDLTPEIGITGTPVIDPAGGFLYVAAKSKQFLTADKTHPRWVYTLFKVSMADGAISASHIIGATYQDHNGWEFRTNNDPAADQDPFVFGTGDGAITVNGQSRVYFNALRQMNRPGLLLCNGNVYIAFASHGDNGPYHGWLLSFDAGSLALTGVFNTTPNGGLGGIWQGGGITTIDDSGNFYFQTGNGTFDGDSDGLGGVVGLDNNGFPNMGNFGDCIMKLAVDSSSTQANQNLNGWGFKVLDYFSPMDNQTLNQNDTDLGSGGVVLLPDSVGSTAHPHLLLGAGKEGKIYLVDRDNMGKFSPYTDNVVQNQANAIGGSFSTASYFNGNFYWVGSGDVAKMFSISNAAFSTSPVSQTADGFDFPGPCPTITANGTANGLVWILARDINQLRVYDAQDLTKQYWNSDLASNSRDKLGFVVKFTTPTVADGFAFVGASSAIYAYGGPPPPTTPPAAPSNLSAIPLSGTEVDLAWVDHAKNEGAFKIEQSTDGRVFTEIATVGTNVTGAYVSGLTPSTFYYFRVRAFNQFHGGAYSAYCPVVGVATIAPTDTLDFSGGFAGAGLQLAFNGSASINSSGDGQITDGGGGEAGSFWSAHPLNTVRFDTEFDFQILPSNSGFADGFTFCLQNNNPQALGGVGGDLGYTGIKKSIAIKFDVYPQLSTTGLYLDGAAPNDNTPQAIDLTPSGIDLHSGHTFHARLTYLYGILTETITDTVTNAVFTHRYAVQLTGALGGSTAYAGFTGGTGGETVIQQIHSWIYAAIPSAAPIAPATLTGAPASGTQINLKWKDRATNETGYLVERSSSGFGPWSFIAVLPPGSASYNDSSLNMGSRFYYTVRASNAAGNSAPSNIIAVSTPTIPVAPTELKVTSLKSAAVSFQWNNPARNAENFVVSRQEVGSGRHTVLATLPVSHRSYTDETAVASTQYIYLVQASNLAGASSSTSLNVTTPAQ